MLLVQYADVWWIIGLALLTGIYSLQYDILRQAIPHDTTFHIYAAQQMLEGHPIYRDVAIIKAPLADFASALAILIARMIHISDIMGTRLMSLAVAMAVTGATYFSVRVLFRSRAVGVIAALVMATWNFYGLRAVTGPEPKEFVILFALLALSLLARKHWGWAGACAALSTLAWQPALLVQAIVMLFAFTAPWLEIKRATTNENMRTALKNSVRALLGFAAPLAIVLLYLVVNNALVAAFNATIGANVVHFNNNQARVPLFQTVDENLAEILTEATQYCFSLGEYWLVGIGGLGLLGIGAAQVYKAAVKKKSFLDLDTTPLFLYTIGFTAFTLIDFDFCPDLIPLLPVLALGIGWLAIQCARTLSAWLSRISPLSDAPRAQMMMSVFVMLFVLMVYGLDALDYRITTTTFLDQLQVAETAKTYLAPGDRVLAFGNAIVLIELHMQNASKILHLGSKSGLGVLASEPGGVQGMIDALDRDPPKLIVLARETYPTWTDPFYAWLAQRYDQMDYFGRANMRFFLLKP